MSENIDNPVWRRWRNQQEKGRKWSWPRFLLSCALAAWLADSAAMLIMEPVVIRVLLILVVVPGLFIALCMEAGTVGSYGKQLLARVIPIAIFSVILMKNVSLKWRFAMVRDEFDEVAERYADGEKVEVPFTIGPWEIVEVNRGYDGSGPVMFWESVGGAGGCGFVRHPEGQGVNTFGVVRLDDQWSWVSED